MGDQMNSACVCSLPLRGGATQKEREHVGCTCDRTIMGPSEMSAKHE